MNQPSRTFAEADRSPEDRAELLRERDQLSRDRPTLDDLLATGDFDEPVSQGEYVALLQVMHRLKAVREGLGLSLADLAERSGIDKAALSRLETGRNPNPSLGTVNRVATALGKRVRLTIEDDDDRKTA